MRLHTDTMEAKSPPRSTARSGPEDPQSLEFIGCRPFTLKLEDLDTHERRFEYWDRDTETAWEIRESTGAGHGIASQRLAALCYAIACVRGSPILCCGATDLDLRDEHGERYRIMQADQTVYLHPRRARLPHDTIVLGEHDFPDVVLEVDYTTDIRRGKLRLYEAWGFPELWVEVPDRYAPSRPRGLTPGLRIYLLEEGSYRTTRESRALAGWTADEIHQALNEDEESEATSRAFRRVGRILGEREGTGSGDTSWLRMERQESRAEGRAEGHAEGRAEGRVKIMEVAMEAIPASRGMAPFRLDERDVRGVTDREVVDALLQCEDESDFQARLERLRREHR